MFSMCDYEGECVKDKSVCFTGHRKIPAEQLNYITLNLKTLVIKLINDGFTDFYAGGALGFDALAAQTVLMLREYYPNIKLILVLPCETQSMYWTLEEKKIYEDIKQRADKVLYTSKRYFRGCMQKRNHCLVDNSSICICYLTEKLGGTAQTVRYAKRKMLLIHNLANELI